MKRIKFILTIISVIFLLPLASFAAQKGPVLNDEQKKFLYDVHWIISDYERNAFLSLKTDADKERFIQAFWDSRDPTPGTPANEFKDEHYKRLAYANRYFGVQAAAGGAMTDMGRVYVLLGKPEFIKRFSNSSEFYPM